MSSSTIAADENAWDQWLSNFIDQFGNTSTTINYATTSDSGGGANWVLPPIDAQSPCQTAPANTDYPIYTIDTPPSPGCDGGYIHYAIDPNLPPPTSYPKLDKLMKNSASLTNNQKAALSTLLEAITDNCFGQALYKYMTDNNKTFDWIPNPNSIAPASYNSTTGAITIKDPESTQMVQLQEELIHAYQDFTIPGGTYQYRTVGNTNVEFEAKLMRDINSWVNGISNSWTVQSDPTYANWINTITQNGTKFPTSYSNISAQYFYYMNEWQTDQFNAQSLYKNNIVNPTLLPNSMFNLINSSTCSK